MSDPKVVVPVVIAIVGLLGFVWLHWGLVPVLQVRMNLEQLETTKRVLRIRLEVENMSKVPALMDESKPPRVRLLEYDLSKDEEGAYGDFVPIDKVSPDERRLPPWSVSRKVLTSTISINPGEIIKIDLLCQPPTLGSVVHGAFQVHVSLSALARFVHRVNRFDFVGKKKLPDRYTTTAKMLA